MKNDVKDCLNCPKPVCDDCKGTYWSRESYHKEYQRERYNRRKDRNDKTASY